MTPLAAAAFFYRGVPRWTFGMDNPNKAAAILAILLLLLLAAALRARRDWLCWTCSALAAAAGYCLVHTFSRGGLAAFVAGALVLAAGFRKELRRRQRWIPALLVMLVLAGSAAWTGFAGRMSGSSPAADASVGNRLTVWRNVPSMMTDAPGGWGRGAAGDAFMGWYQPLDRRERYRTLVNSHFTWLVEHGWVVRLCYVWGLVFFLWAGALRLKARGDPLPLAVWACFVVAAFFSSVAEDWLVCAIPLAMLVPMLRTFWTSSAKRATLAGSLLVSGVLLSCAVVLGVACRPPGVIPVCRSLDGGRMVVGEGASADLRAGRRCWAGRAVTVRLALRRAGALAQPPRQVAGRAERKAFHPRVLWRVRAVMPG